MTFHIMGGIHYNKSAHVRYDITVESKSCDGKDRYDPYLLFSKEYNRIKLKLT